MAFDLKRNRLLGSLASLPFVIAMSCPTDAMAQAQPPAPKAPSAPAQAGIATNDHEISGVEVTLLELKRTSGDTITARWRYKNSNPKREELVKGYGGNDPWKLALDSYLIDGVNKKKYLLLTDANNVPIAGKHGGAGESIFVGPGASLSTWAKYPAPPEHVKKITLYINGVAPFEDIPISQ